MAKTKKPAAKAAAVKRAPKTVRKVAKKATTTKAKSAPRRKVAKTKKR